MTLAQAPAALRTAALKALGRHGTSLQKAKLTASDGASGDTFGYSVAVSGTTAVVGAFQKTVSRGEAYVFVLSGTTWSQQAKLTATRGAFNDQFGRSVGISGSTVLVGAPGSTSSKGATYVFVLSGTTWSQQAKLTATGGASGDAFGISVALSGSTAVIGAYGRSSRTGAAYVFVRSGSTWSQQAMLTASDRASGDLFGNSVAFSGSTALVGATARNSTTGAAYVFVRSGISWSQQAELIASDGASNDGFGGSVAIVGDTALVGANGKNSLAGAAYVFVRSGASWSQQVELIASDGASSDRFGYSVALSGSTALVGACCKNSLTGAAYVFVGSGASWAQDDVLTSADAASGDFFGASVALSGSTAVVGAYGKSSNTGEAYVFALPYQQAKLPASDGVPNNLFGTSVAVSGSTAVVGTYDGAAYVFVRSGTKWSQQAKLIASDGVPGDLFGRSLAVSGSTAVVGAYGKNSQTGAAYVFVRSGTTWSQQAKLIASGGLAGDNFGGSVAVVGSTVLVGASAKNSYTGAAYVFVRSGTTWSQQTRLTASDGVSGDDFGFSVALSSSTAVIGAPGKNSSTGAAYVFVRSGTAWSDQATLIASDGVSGDAFGAPAALFGDTAVVGNYQTGAHPGAVYVFVRSGTTWAQQAKLTALDGATFGFSVALSSSTAVVGAPFNNSAHTGAAYVFVRSGTTWSQQAELTASDSASGNFFGASVALSGSTAVVGAEGNNSGTGAAYVFVLP